MRLIVLLIFWAFTPSHCELQFSDLPLNFSTELVYHTQLTTDGDFVISPFGIWTLLVVILHSVQGNSRAQVDHHFYWNEPETKIPQTVTGNQVRAGDPRNLGSVTEYRNLTSTVLSPHPATGVIFTNRNFVFLDKDIKAYFKFVGDNFNISLTRLDFKKTNVSDIANRHIEASGAKVKNVLSSDDFADKALVLSNVIYFKGLWTIPFNVSDTAQESFYDEDNLEIGRVNMMHHKSGFIYSNIEELEAYALELPYGTEKRFSMLILLPYQEVKVIEVCKNIAGKYSIIKDIFEQIERDVNEYGDEEISVKIPRFKIGTQLVMNQPLKDMGVQDIFDKDNATFNQITDDQIYVSAIVHRADIEVSELGTEASASTKAVFSGRFSAPPFHANRPFIYLLMEKSTMTMLFAGVYSKPSLF